MSEEEIKRLLPYSVKISTDQKCVKIDTHAYSDIKENAVSDAIEMWLSAKARIEKEGFKVAPLDVEK